MVARVSNPPCADGRQGRRQPAGKVGVGGWLVSAERRLWKPQAKHPEKASVWRDLRVLATGTRAECESLVREHADIDLSDGIARAYVLRRGDGLPAREQLVVAAPSGTVGKARPSFPLHWEAAAHQQLTLAA